MKEILNYVNNNVGVVSLITLMVTIVFQIIMTKSDRRYNEKQENKKNLQMILNLKSLKD